jgi:hypothetical protein
MSGQRTLGEPYRSGDVLGGRYESAARPSGRNSVSVNDIGFENVTVYEYGVCAVQAGRLSALSRTVLVTTNRIWFLRSALRLGASPPLPSRGT